MTRGDASQLLARLMAAFPSAPLERESVILYIEAIGKFRQHDVAAEAVEEIIRNEERFPPIAVILAVYYRLCRERENAVNKLPEWQYDAEVAADARRVVCERFSVRRVFQSGQLCGAQEGALPRRSVRSAPIRSTSIHRSSGKDDAGTSVRPTSRYGEAR